MSIFFCERLRWQCHCRAFVLILLLPDRDFDVLDCFFVFVVLFGVHTRMRARAHTHPWHPEAKTKPSLAACTNCGLV